MLKSLFFVTLLCLVPFLDAHRRHGHGGDDDDETPVSSTPYQCTLDGFGHYDLSQLYKSSGSAYAAKDENGNVFYFNLCGDLSQLNEAQIGCDPTATVCVQTSFGAFMTTGRPEGIWTEAESYNGVQVVYANGDYCADGSNFQTTLRITCANDVTDLMINNVNYTNCETVIDASHSAACMTSSQWSTERHRHVSGGLVFVISALACCCLSLCVCACCRRRMRRRCHRQQQAAVELNKYQPLQTVARPTAPQRPVQQMQPQQAFVPAQPRMPVVMQPYIVPHQFQAMQQQQTFQPQYFQPPSYFMYPPVQAPTMPMVPTTNDALEHRDVQLDEDEKLARELQSKFDNEN